jgi:hypothetical protein
MKTKGLVKHIKRRERSRRSPRPAIKIEVGPNKWSKSVRSWIVEFQERDRDESQPAFDSLFKDQQPAQPEDAD